MHHGSTVRELKQQISEEQVIPESVISKASLVYRESILNDSSTLAQCGLRSGAHLHLVLSLAGGHGPVAASLVTPISSSPKSHPATSRTYLNSLFSPGEFLFGQPPDFESSCNSTAGSSSKANSGCVVLVLCREADEAYILQLIMKDGECVDARAEFLGSECDFDELSHLMKSVSCEEDEESGGGELDPPWNPPDHRSNKETNYSGAEEGARPTTPKSRLIQILRSISQNDCDSCLDAQCEASSSNNCPEELDQNEILAPLPCGTGFDRDHMYYTLDENMEVIPEQIVPSYDGEGMQYSFDEDESRPWSAASSLISLPEDIARQFGLDSSMVKIKQPLCQRLPADQVSKVMLLTSNTVGRPATAIAITRIPIRPLSGVSGKARAKSATAFKTFEIDSSMGSSSQWKVRERSKIEPVPDEIISMPSRMVGRMMATSCEPKFSTMARSSDTFLDNFSAEKLYTFSSSGEDLPVRKFYFSPTK
jgi:hypothetical protein